MFQISLKDELRDVFKHWLLIKKLALVEVKLQYKGSVIGVFWGCISFGVKVLVLTIVYSKVMSKPAGEYLPYLALGILTWQYISSLVLGGGVFFTKNKQYLLQFRRPFSIFIAVSVLKNAILFFLNLILILPFVFYHCGFSMLALGMFFVGFLMISLLGILCYYILGVFCLLIPDVKHMMQSIMTIGFVVTPVLWSSEALEGSWVLIANPFYHFINLLREPLLHHQFPFFSFVVTLVFMFSAFLLSWYILNRFGRKVLLWL